VCPVDAIYFEDDLPGESHEYHKVKFFTYVDGVSSTGKFHSDHPIVAALPPQLARY
jgi:hypothetical protein